MRKDDIVMSFKEKIQSVISMANEKASELQQFKAANPGNSELINQKCNELRQEVQQTRDNAVNDFKSFAGERMTQIKKSREGGIRYAQDTFQNMHFTEYIQKLKYGELEDLAENYIKTGTIENASVFDIGAVQALINELNSRNEPRLTDLANRVSEANKNYHTDEPHRNDPEYAQLESLINSINTADANTIIDDQGKKTLISDIIA